MKYGDNMDNNKLTKSEVISIVMNLVDIKTAKDIYGDIVLDKEYISKNIESKLNSYSEEDRELFWNGIYEIVDEIYDLKSGELNQLNMMHMEIVYLSEEYINDFISWIN